MEANGEGADLQKEQSLEVLKLLSFKVGFRGLKKEKREVLEISQWKFRLKIKIKYSKYFSLIKLDLNSLL